MFRLPHKLEKSKDDNGPKGISKKILGEISYMLTFDRPFNKGFLKQDVPVV